MNPVPQMSGLQIEDADLQQAQIASVYEAQLRTLYRQAERRTSGIVRDYGKNSTVDVAGNLHAAACAVVVVRTEHNGNRVMHIWRDGHGRRLTRGECTTLVGRMRCHETLSMSSLLSRFAPDN